MVHHLLAELIVRKLDRRVPLNLVPRERPLSLVCYRDSSGEISHSRPSIRAGPETGTTSDKER